MFVMLLVITMMGVTDANVLDSGDKNGECQGNVVLYEGSEETKVTEDGDVEVVVDKVMVEGCGCFTIHSKKGGRGKSFFLRSVHGAVSPSDIGWAKVRSVRKVACENRAMPLWGVILLVVGVVVVTGALAVLGLKKYRQYRQINQSENVQ